MSDSAHPLTLWLARACVALYTLALLISVSDRGSTLKRFKLWRTTWSVACLLLIVHVLSAFHFEHGWSHAAALKHTSEQTVRVTGIDWGGGLYFNYAFMALWFLDVAFLWRASRNRQSTLRRVTALACIFMVFNATVVFGPRWWMGPAVIVGLLYVQFRRQIPAGVNDNRTVEN